MTDSVQIEECHYLPHFLGLITGLQQEAAVMEGEADDLLHPGDDVVVTYPAP